MAVQVQKGRILVVKSRVEGIAGVGGSILSAGGSAIIFMGRLSGRVLTSCAVEGVVEHGCRVYTNYKYQIRYNLVLDDLLPF